MVACSAVPAAGASSVRQTKSKKVSRDKVLRRETETLDAPATRCSSSHNKPQTQKVSEMFPRHVNPMQWQLAMDYARQACARIFRDGGSAAEALSAFDLPAEETSDWNTSVSRIAEALCASAQRKAA